MEHTHTMAVLHYGLYNLTVFYFLSNTIFTHLWFLHCFCSAFIWHIWCYWWWTFHCVFCFDYHCWKKKLSPHAQPKATCM